MNAIVPHGYAIPKEEIKRRMDELRKTRAAELSSASAMDRARIESEIRCDATRKTSLKHRIGGLFFPNHLP